MNLERIFYAATVILAAIAAYFLYAGNADALFAAAVLAASAYFLGVRYRIKKRNEIGNVDADKREAVAKDADGA